MSLTVVVTYISLSSAVCSSRAELIRNEYICEPRGVVHLKGKGDMQTYLLLSRKA